MRRRDVITRIGAAGIAGTAGVGAASADRGMTIVWERDDGTVRRLSEREFDQHPETPSLVTLTDECCDCTDCECRYPPCESIQ